MKRRRFLLETAAAAGIAVPAAGAAAPASGSTITESELQFQLDAAGTVELPPGEIMIHQGLRLRPGTILRGSGWYSVLRAAPALGVPIIRLVQPAAAAAEREIQGCGIETVYLLGGGDTPVGIDYGADPSVPGSNPRSCWIRGVRIQGFQAGVRAHACEGGNMSDCKLIHNGTGVLVGNAASGVQLSHCDFRHNASALRVEAGQPSNEWLVAGCQFESNTGTAVWLAGAQAWAFLRCKWEGNAAHVVLDSPDATNVSLRPDGHQFIGATLNATTGDGPGISVNEGTRLCFQGCTASPLLTTAIAFRAGWGSLLLSCALRQDQVAGLHAGITVAPGSLT
jgi:hypothetical protein